MFLASLVSGLVGAIIINFIDKFIAKKQKSELQDETINKRNKILATQGKQRIVSEEILEETKANAQSSVTKRHHEAAETMKESFSNIMENFVDNLTNEEELFAIDDEDIKTNKALDETSDELDKLLSGL